MVGICIARFLQRWSSLIRCMQQHQSVIFLSVDHGNGLAGDKVPSQVAWRDVDGALGSEGPLSALRVLQVERPDHFPWPRLNVCNHFLSWTAHPVLLRDGVVGRAVGAGWRRGPWYAGGGAAGKQQCQGYGSSEDKQVLRSRLRMAGLSI